MTINNMQVAETFTARWVNPFPWFVVDVENFSRVITSATATVGPNQTATGEGPAFACWIGNEMHGFDNAADAVRMWMRTATFSEVMAAMEIDS